MKNVLFFGTMVSDKQSDVFLKNGIIPAPADIVQKYMIEGLLFHNEYTIFSICSPRITTDSNNSLKRVIDEDWCIQDCKVKTIGYINTPFIGYLQRYLGIIKEAKQWVKMHRDDDNTLIVYSLHSPFLLAATIIKRKSKNARIVVIVPDLPRYMSNYTGIKRLLKKLDGYYLNKIRRVVDKYVLYTKYMAEYLQLKDKWMVMEGLIDIKKIKKKEYVHNPTRVCVYAGSLNLEYAIDKMILAFASLNNAVLHIYGRESEYNENTRGINVPPNVVYKGFVNQQDIFSIMQNSDLLINPRPTGISLAKYSCPSKTFEYMASGTPVLMNKLPGLPEEYYPYLFFFDDESLEGYVNTLQRIMALPDEELRRKGEAAQSFLKTSKNNKAVMDRILSFIEEQ